SLNHVWAPSGCSVWNRIPAEKRDGVLVGFAEPLGVEAAERAVGVGLGERAIDDQPERVISGRKGERERLVREQAIEDDDVGAAACQVEEDRAFAEERVGAALHDGIDSGV